MFHRFRKQSINKSTDASYWIDLIGIILCNIGMQLKNIGLNSNNEFMSGIYFQAFYNLECFF